MVKSNISQDNIIKDVLHLSNNYTRIIRREELKNYKELNWGNNGIGDRWARKLFNYTVIYNNGKTKIYNNNDTTVSNQIDKDVLERFIKRKEVVF